MTDHMHLARVHFQSSKAWPDSGKVHELLPILKKYDDIGLYPERFGPHEAYTYSLLSLAETDVEKIWYSNRGGNFKRKRPWGLSISTLYDHGRAFKIIGSSQGIYLHNRFFEDAERSSRFIELCKDIFHWGEFDHGSVSLYSEYETKNSFGPGRGVGGPNIKVALPGVYWANFFGPVYVEWLGRDKFTTLKAYQTEELSGSGWMIVTRPNLPGYDQSRCYPEEKRLIHHLCSDAFFEMENPKKRTIAPIFPSQ